MDPLAFSFSPPALRDPKHYFSAKSPDSNSGTRPGLPPSSSSSSPSVSILRSPKIYGAPGMSLPDSSAEYDSMSPTTGKGKGRERERRYLQVRITGLERNRKDLLVRFDASTNLPNFRTGMYRNMQRSYVEFQKFAEQAQLTSPQTIIPALPLASTSATTDEEDDRLVRIALQRWLSRISDDPALQLDEELRSFIESDFGYSPTPPLTARRNTSAASAVPHAFTAAISKVVRRGPLDSDDELSSAKAALDRLEVTWGGAAAAINNLGKARRAHALANQDVGAKLINLSTVESDIPLAAAERKMGRALETLAGLAGTQSASENIVLGDSLAYQALNARAAKEALIQRSQLLEDAQTSSKTSIQKRRTLERLKGSSSINPSKVDDAIAEMEDAELLESTLNRQLANISTNLHMSMRSHSRNTHEDVALALLENAKFGVGWHKRVLGELEACRPELNRVGGDGVGIQTGVVGAGRKVVDVGGPLNVSTPAQQQPHMTGSRPYNSPPQNSQSRPSPREFGQGQQSTASGTSQSMFLPPPPTSTAQPRSHAPFPQQYQSQPAQPPRPSNQAQNLDPLGGQITQSMVLPPGHRPGGAPGTVGRGTGRRLDERQAAKLLSGGF